MTNGDAAAAGGEQPDQQQGGGGGGGGGPLGGINLQDVARMIFWFFLFQNLAHLAQQHGFLPNPNMPQPDAAPGGGAGGPAERFQQGRNDAGRAGPVGVTSPTGGQAKHTSCLWSPGTAMSMHVFFTDSDTLELPDSYDYHASPVTSDSKGIKGVLSEWHETGLTLYDANEKRTTNITIPLTKSIRHNETHLYAHIRLARKSDEVRNGEEGSSAGGGGNEVDILSKRIELTRHRLRKRIRDEKSLLGDADDKSSSSDSNSGTATEIDEADDDSPLSIAGRNATHDEVLLYATPTMTLQLVDMTTSPKFPNRKSIPAQFGDHMDWLDDESEQFYPIVYPSEFWVTKTSLLEINGTTQDITLEATFEPVKMWKWQLMSQMEQSWKQQEQFMGEEDSGGSDMFRTLLLETNPFFLAVTAIVSVLHTIFDILAFKNDISFFKGRKSMEGLSLRTMIVNALFQVVILAYLADNETSMMVLSSNGIGLAIEIWKISKAVTVSYSDGKIQWVESKSYTESKTKEYDEIATSHLLYITMPLVTGYGVYSLIHLKHKGYYSWILNSLVSFIYIFGFVMMTPQLFINYKLKSVAHLNWRTMTYKSINTFIDDLFAFVIKMPIMHRLACLRDDVVFFIFCYQRYIYKIDFTRVNEFGQCLQPTEEMIKEMEKEKAKEQITFAAGSGTETSIDAVNTSNAAGSTTVRQRRGARDRRN